MTARPSTRTEPPARLHERPPDPVEASTTPLEPKESADPQGGPTPRDPHHELNNPASDPDPTSDSDPYQREPESPGAPQGSAGDGRRERAADPPQDAGAAAERGRDADARRGSDAENAEDPDADPEMKRAAQESLHPPDDE